MTSRSHNEPRSRGGLAPASARESGFALVVVVSMMVLVSLLAVGVLGLSSIALRGASSTRAMVEARANARLGMLLALGELQEKLGADQRVSVPAESLARALGGPVHDDWRVATAVVAREKGAEGGSLEERLRDGFRGWLISGGAEGVASLDSAAASRSGDSVSLMGDGRTPGAEALAGYVEVAGKTRGRYAWWVEDLGTKASAGLPRQQDESLRLLAPDRFGLRAMEGFESMPGRQSGAWDRIPTTGSIALAGDTAEWLERPDRPVTHRHRGLLVDVAEGRLKRDLSVALGSDRARTERLLGERVYEPVAGVEGDPGGPRWELLRDYYQSGGRTELVVTPHARGRLGYHPVVAGVTEIYGLSNTVGYAPSAAPHPSLGPEWYNRRTNGRDVHVMTFHFTPVIKLWNPYDLPMRAPDGFTVAVANGNAQHSGAGGDGSYQDVIYWGRNGGVALNIDARPPKTVRFEHRYYIPPVTFGPGEARVFSLASNRFLDLDGSYRPFTGRPLGDKTDVVGAGWILGELKDISTGGFTGASFWDLMFTKRDLPIASRSTLNWGGGRSIGGTGGTDGGDIQVLDSENPGGLGFKVVPHPFSTWSIRLYDGRAPLAEQGQPDPRRPLVDIRNVNTDTTGFSKGNTAFVSNPDPTRHPLFLDPSGMDSIWARRFVLKQVLNEGDDDPGLYNPARSSTKDARWLVNFNPRSPTVGCWPYEHRKPDRNALFTGARRPLIINGSTHRGSRGFGLGTPGNYLSGMLPELVSRDALFLNTAIGFSDFAGPDRCVLFQTPLGDQPGRYFFSIGQLRHANLWIEDGDYGEALSAGHGTEDWFPDNMQPAWAIGNSYADPRLDPDENRGLFRPLTVEDEGHAYRSVQRDLSYFLNRSLWDAFFFSALGDAGEDSRNSRLTRTGSGKPEPGERGFERNAAALWTDGAFNINSTDPEAWAAFVSSLTEVSVGGVETERAAYPTVMTDTSGEVDAGTAVDAPEQYAGFRSLEREEVRELAAAIVEEIKERGPALSLGEFVNRTVDGFDGDHRLKGVIQAAIDATTLNDSLREEGMFVIDEGDAGRVYDRDAFAGDIAAGVPGYLTQGELCERLGHLMTARSDTFTIRSRGESLDSRGQVVARAVCEATVQRVPEYVDPAIAPETPFDELPASSAARRFGRAFRVVSFRWLASGER